MASVATANPPQIRRKRGLAVSTATAATLVLFCCFLTLGITFLHGSMLDTLASQNANHLDTLVSNLHQGRGPLPSDLRVSSLSCSRFGGPEIAQEMVYWQDIASDSKYKSPFFEPNVTRYMTFEQDEGGFNNIRMALETVLAIAHASGRTLVLVRAQDFLLASEAQLFPLIFCIFVVAQPPNRRLASEAQLFPLSSHILHICRRPATRTGNVLAL
jgi:hypothetical protein